MNERGSVTFWLLGLSFALMSLGVLSVDLWALIAERRELAALADAAASAAAGAIDESAWRQDGRLSLDREDASSRARSVLEAGRSIDDVRIEVGDVTVRVTLNRHVETALLGLAGRDVVEVGAASEATAVLRD